MNPLLGSAIGAVSGFIGVALGAFGAHGLRERVDARMLEIWQTAAHYQMIHAVALVALGAWCAARPELAQGWPARLAALGFALGTLVFSGSLYALVLSGVRALGAVTPLGGLLFLAGWACLAAALFRAQGRA